MAANTTPCRCPSVAQDPLKFRDQKRYIDRLKEARIKTGMEDAVLVATGKLYGTPVTVAVQDFDFMGGSLGMAAGSAIITGLEKAADTKTPFVLFASSGGARMQEGILSLMQMPRTTVAVLRLRDAGLPFIVVFTNPTTGGVTASYAMLGDVHIAEPGALICFAGPRVIEQTIREKLPKGFQRSEYLYEHGMVDMVVHRHNLRSTIGSLVAMFTKADVARPSSPQRRPSIAARRRSPMTTTSTRPGRRRRRRSSARRSASRQNPRHTTGVRRPARRLMRRCPAPMPS